MTAVKVAQSAVAISSEHRDRRILTAFAIFAAEIIFESAFAGAQQTQFVPTSFTSVRSQGGGIGGSDDREVNILRQVMSDTVVAIEPRSAHRTRLRLFLS